MAEFTNLTAAMDALTSARHSVLDTLTRQTAQEAAAAFPAASAVRLGVDDDDCTVAWVFQDDPVDSERLHALPAVAAWHEHGWSLVRAGESIVIPLPTGSPASRPPTKGASDG